MCTLQIILIAVGFLCGIASLILSSTSTRRYVNKPSKPCCYDNCLFIKHVYIKDDGSISKTPFDEEGNPLRSCYLDDESENGDNDRDDC